MSLEDKIVSVQPLIAKLIREHFSKAQENRLPVEEHSRSRLTLFCCCFFLWKIHREILDPSRATCHLLHGKLALSGWTSANESQIGNATSQVTNLIWMVSRTLTTEVRIGVSKAVAEVWQLEDHGINAEVRATSVWVSLVPKTSVKMYPVGEFLGFGTGI